MVDDLTAGSRAMDWRVALAVPKIHVSATFDQRNNRVLGVQVIGGIGNDSRVGKKFFIV